MGSTPHCTRPRGGSSLLANGALGARQIPRCRDQQARQRLDLSHPHADRSHRPRLAGHACRGARGVKRGPPAHALSSHQAAVRTQAPLSDRSAAALAAAHARRSPFPSGHAMTLTGVLAPIVIAWPATTPSAALLLLSMAWSRIATAHHYPSDVVAGAALGAGLSYPLASGVLAYW
ncbi:MAG: phosphatase PAP2 family protein [Methylocystis sp.]